MAFLFFDVFAKRNSRLDGVLIQAQMVSRKGRFARYCRAFLNVGANAIKAPSKRNSRLDGMLIQTPVVA
jgi:hypothetical protein